MNSKRSIKLLIESLLGLLEDKRIDKITITELTREAGLVRNTFYAHFEKVEDVLIYHILESYKIYLAHILESQDKGDIDYDLAYFEFWSENKDLLKLIAENGIFHIVSKSGDYFTSLFEELNISDVCNVSNKAMPFADAFFSDALASILRRWVQLHMRQSPSELNDIYKEFTTGIRS